MEKVGNKAKQGIFGSMFISKMSFKGPRAGGDDNGGAPKL